MKTKHRNNNRNLERLEMRYKTRYKKKKPMNAFRMVPVKENENRNDGLGAETEVKNIKIQKRQILI